MALPTLFSRPEKTVSSALSRWNAAALPIQYVISNTKWPVNSEDALDAFSGVDDDGGYARFSLINIPVEVGDYVEVTGSANYDGIHRVLRTNIPLVTLDTAFIASDTGDMQFYYQNYTSLIRVYVNATLIGNIEQRPNTDNKTYVDIRRYVLSQLLAKNDINGASFPNDTNLWTSFYIEFAERYDDIISGTPVNTISAYSSDSGSPCYGVHGALQFGNLRGGNMINYLSISPFAHDINFMTFFDRPKMFFGKYYDISILVGETSVYLDDLRIRERDINGDLLDTQLFALSDNGVGLYRIRLDDKTYNANTSYIELDWPDNSVDAITIDIDRKCSDQDLLITWLNTLGGWEYWNFTARKTYNFNMPDVQTIQRDILQDWDADFIAGETDREHISVQAAQTVVVRSQNLTRQQVEAIARLKFSIKVQDFTDSDNPITVLVDKGSIAYTTDKEKTNFIEFTITYPGIIIQQQ